MNKNRQNQGITLIALIITIIVMLILVAVTISMAVNGGLFDYAGKAVGETQNAINAEQQLANGKVEIGGIWYDSLEKYIDGIPSEDNTSLIALFKLGKLKVGDYVDYNPSGVASVNPDDPEGIGTATAGALTGYTSKTQSVAQEKLAWRVLGVDGDNLLLISATPTTANGAITFYGHVGYNNYEDVLEETCSKLYSNASIGATARSITMNDIDTYLGGSAFPKASYLGGSTVVGGYGYTTSFTNIYTPDNWTNTNSVELTSLGYSYEAGKVITDTTKLELLQGNNPDSLYYYWVNTCCLQIARSVRVFATWGGASVYDGEVKGYGNLCNEDGSENDIDDCLRPVVSIPANVTIEDVPVLETTPSYSWDDPLEKYSSAPL